MCACVHTCALRTIGTIDSRNSAEVVRGYKIALLAHTWQYEKRYPTNLCTCEIVCVCIGGFSGTHTQIVSGEWGYPQIQKSLVKQSRGSMHAIGCPLALLESSIFPPVTGKISYLLCNFFKHFFGLLTAMFLGTSYEYTP